MESLGLVFFNPRSDKSARAFCDVFPVLDEKAMKVSSMNDHQYKYRCKSVAINFDMPFFKRAETVPGEVF
jgi:hypothetical protein